MELREAPAFKCEEQDVKLELIKWRDHFMSITEMKDAMQVLAAERENLVMLQNLLKTPKIFARCLDYDQWLEMKRFTLAKKLNALHFYLQKINFNVNNNLRELIDEPPAKRPKIDIETTQKDENRIFIASRTLSESDLERKKSNEIKNLDRDEQRKFLVGFWSENNSNLDANLIENCSKLLGDKISSFIGVPLLIQGLAEVYKNEIDKSFASKIKNLNICEVFERILNLNPTFKDGQEQFNDFEFQAIAHLFDEDLAASLSFASNSLDVRKQPKHDKLEFKHETHAQYLAAKVAFKVLSINGTPSSSQIELLMRVLLEEKFQVTRMFLNDQLEGQTLNFPCEKFCKAIDEHEEGEGVLCHAAREGLFNIFMFVVKMIKSPRLLAEILLEKLPSCKQVNFIKILVRVQARGKIAILLREILRDKRVARRILTFFNAAKLLCKIASLNSRKNLKFLFVKVKELFGDDHTKELFTVRVSGKKLLDWAGIESANFNYLAKFLKETCTKGELNKLYPSNLDDFLSVLGKDEENIEFVMRRAKNVFRTKENFKFLLSTCHWRLSSMQWKCESLCVTFSEGIEFGNTELRKTHKVFELTLNNFKSCKSSDDLIMFLMTKLINGRNHFKHSKSFRMNQASANFLLNLAKKELNSGALRSILDPHDSVEMLPFNCAILTFNEENLKLCLSMYEENLSEHELKGLLMQRTKNGNILHLAAMSNEFNSLKMLIKLVARSCGVDEMKKMLSECHGSLPLHLVVKNKSFGAADVEFMFTVYEENFSKSEIENFLRVKSKSPDFSTIFELTNDSNTLKFLLRKAKVYSKFSYHRFRISQQIGSKYSDEFKSAWSEMEGDLKVEEIAELINEVNNKNHNLLHLAAVCLQNREIFKFLWLKIRLFVGAGRNFGDYLNKNGGFYKINAFSMSIQHKNETFFALMFEKLTKDLNCDNCHRKMSRLPVFKFNMPPFVNSFINKEASACDVNRENFFSLLASKGSLSMIKFALNKLKAQLNVEILKNYLTKRFRNGESFSSLALVRDAVGNFTLDFIKHILRRDELKDIFKSIVRDIDKFIKVLPMLEGTFTRQELSEIIRSSRSFAVDLIKHPNKDLVEIFLNWIDRNCPRKCIQELFGVPDSHLRCPLHFALMNATSLSIFSRVFAFYERHFEKEDLLSFITTRKHRWSCESGLYLAIKAGKDFFKLILRWIEDVFGESKVKSIIDDSDLFSYAICRAKFKTLKFLFKIYEKKLTPAEVCGLLEGQRQYFYNNRELYYTDPRQIKEFLSEKLHAYSPLLFVQMRLLKLLSEDASKKSSKRFQTLWTEVVKKSKHEEIFKIVKHENVNCNIEPFMDQVAMQQNILRFVCFDIEQLFNFKQKRLIFDNKSLRNVLVTSCTTDLNLFLYLFEGVFCSYFDLEEFIFATNDMGQNLMHILARETSIHTFQFAQHRVSSAKSQKLKDNMRRTRILKTIESLCETEDMRKLLITKDIDDRLPFDYAMKNTSLSTFKYFFVIYAKTFKFNEMRNILKRPCVYRKRIAVEARQFIRQNLFNKKKKYFN